jgi:hypothetical protein
VLHGAAAADPKMLADRRDPLRTCDIDAQQVAACDTDAT